METLNIMRMGQLARRSGLGSQTIHYYLRKGYLHPPLSKHGNQAFYDETHLERLKALKKCKQKDIPFAFCDQFEEREASLGKRAVRKERPREGGSTTRDNIIEVASKVFLQRGYRNTTITEIMTRVGVTKPSFYYYFENKKDLYFVCLDRIFDTIFVEALERIRHEEEPLKRFELRMRSSRLFLAEMITILQLIKESLREEDEDHRLRASAILRKALIDPLSRDLERGMRKGVFRDVESEVVSYILVSVLETVAYRSMISEKLTDADIEKAMLDFIFNALCPPESE